MHILLFQIEKEYGAQSKLVGPADQIYVNWAAKMAVETGTGVPLLMCKEDDALDPVQPDMVGLISGLGGRASPAEPPPRVARLPGTAGGTAAVPRRHGGGGARLLPQPHLS
ncbi:Beta-galactosidase 5 [Glycine soja]